MKQLVGTNIEQSFRLLNTQIPEFSQEFATLAAADSSYERGVRLYGSLTLWPELYIDDGGLVRCAQQGYLGFFVLRQAIRCLLLGVNYQVAGDLMLQTGLYGPAVASYYTAAYHVLHSFLALEGRVLFDTAIWPIPSRRPPQDRHQPYIALLTVHNSWVFEPRPRNHRRKWLEVKQAFASLPDALPACFHKLFGYMYHGVFQRGVDLLETIKNPDKYRVRLADRFEDFLTRIAETRHLSIYGSFGSDPNVVDALWNGDVFSTRGIENQAVQFGEFSGSLLMRVASDVKGIMGRLSLNQKLHNALTLSIHYLPFDDPQSDGISDPELADAVKEISAWVDAALHCDATP